MQTRFIKLNAAGGKQSDDAPNWDAVEDTKTGLIWSIKETPRMDWKAAAAHCASLPTCGQSDWRLPTFDELNSLVDRTKYDPAIDTNFFPACKSGAYWTSTPAAYSPGDLAWLVGFDGGAAGWSGQYGEFFVRACRPSQS